MKIRSFAGHLLKSLTMPYVDRTTTIVSYAASNFQSYGFVRKIQHAVVASSTVAFMFVPIWIHEFFTGRRIHPNRGRLKTIIEGQIYQQTYGVFHQTNSTIFVNRAKDALLIHTPPEITPDFLADMKRLEIPVKYIFISNDFHETHAGPCKDAFPTATVITPERCKDLVSESCCVDATLESKLDELKEKFGFVKMFKADGTVSCMADRSFIVELFDGDGDSDGDATNKFAKQYCLFYGQCGIGNLDPTAHRILGPLGVLTGFTGGRAFRMFYWSFTPDQKAVRPYWTNVVNYSDNLQAAVFQHGKPILGPHTKEELLAFYVY